MLKVSKAIGKSPIEILFLLKPGAGMVPRTMLPFFLKPTSAATSNMSERTFSAIHSSSISTWISSFSCLGITLSFLISTFVYSFTSFIFLFSINLFYLLYQFDFILFLSSSIFAFFLIRSAPYFWMIPWVAIGCILPYLLSKKIRLFI